MEVDMLELAKAQAEYPELVELLKSKFRCLDLIFLQWGQDCNRVCVDHAGNVLRSYSPASLRRRVFDIFHSALAHGIAEFTDQVIRQRYVWPSMHRDIEVRCKACLDCQKSKVSWHVKNHPAPFIPDWSVFIWDHGVERVRGGGRREVQVRRPRWSVSSCWLPVYSASRRGRERRTLSEHFRFTWHGSYH